MVPFNIESNVTLFILEFVRSVVMNDFTERTDSLISVVNNWQRNASFILVSPQTRWNLLGNGDKILINILNLLFIILIILIKDKHNFNYFKYNF